MLGGGTAGAAGFAPHARELASEFRVVRLESLRMEASQTRASLPPGYSIETESAGITCSLDRLGIREPVHLVGHSFGALVALDFALDHPGRVRTLVLAEPPAFWVVPAEELRAGSDMRAMVDLVRTLGPRDEPTDEQLVQFQSRLGRAGARAPAQGQPGREEWEAKRAALRGLSAVATHADDPRRLRTFRRPVLIVTGATTVSFHRRINSLLAATLPAVEHFELDGGHGAPATHPNAFVAKLREFWRQGKADEMAPGEADR
jgi:pimeloyl-ACP methyl ester carboxylesterase